MKRYIVIVLILAGILLALQVVNAHASSLRDFQNTQELEQFLDRGKQPILFIAQDGVPVNFNGGICVPRAEGFIRGAGQAGYQVGRYVITSPDYYRYWYNEPLPPNEQHGVVWAEIAGRTYLIKPTVPMAWELTNGRAGKKVGGYSDQLITSIRNEVRE